MFRNNVNDPLVNSIKSVMEQNETLRRVKEMVNEHFGVESKKSLPHEFHAEYDAMFAQAINEAKKEDDKEEPVKTPEYHRTEAIRAHKAMKAGNDSPAVKAKKKMHEDAYKKMTGNNISYPKTLDEKVEPEKYSPDQKKLAMLGNVVSKKGNPEEIDKHDLDAARKGHAHKVGLEEKASEEQKAKVAKVMHKWKQGKEHIGKSEKTVPVTPKGRKQAIAIALSQAGLSKKQMDEETNIKSVMEEIRTNLENHLVAVYESGDQVAFESFISSLTEEQIDILGLNEDVGKFSNPNIAKVNPANVPIPAGQKAKMGMNTGGEAPAAPSTGERIKTSIRNFFTGGSQPPDTTKMKVPAADPKDSVSRGPVSTVKPGQETRAGMGSASHLGSRANVPSGSYVQSAQNARASIHSSDRPYTPQSIRPDVDVARERAAELKKIGGPGGARAPATAKPAGSAAAARPQTTSTATKASPATAARRPAMAQRPAQAARPTMARRPGQAAAAAQKRVGYSTTRAGASAGETMMGNLMREDEAPAQIKESFESFLRNKFLKG